MNLRKATFGLLSAAIVAVPAAIVAGPFATSAAMAQEKNEQFIPVLGYRTGPYGFAGSALIGGMQDYWALLNERDGGIGGVKLVYEECEFGYNSDRGVECYERLKKKGPTGASFVHPQSTGVTYRLIERATVDKIPIISVGYGRTDASDGRVFPYIFPLMTNYWSQNTAKIKFIGMREGGMDKLKGLKIANLYHESSYGRETIPILDVQAEKYGFEVKHYPVAHPGLDQKASWLDMSRRFKPDWVILRGWGVMNPTAIREAARNRFPREKMVGVWWAGSEEDVLPAGKAAVGYIAAGFHASGKDFPIHDDIMEFVYPRGKGNLSITRLGSIYYNRGLVFGILSAEGIRTAQGKFGNRPLTGEEIRWGLENLNITPERLKEMGVAGLLPSFKLSCRDHEGGGAVRFQQWDGEKWNSISDWIQTDQSIVRPMIEASAAKYAKEKGITPRVGMSMGSDCG